MMGLPYGEEIVTVGHTMWTQSTSVTDRQTDRRTDRITITNTVQRIASHGKKLKSQMVSRAQWQPKPASGTFLTLKEAYCDKSIVFATFVTHKN